MEATQLKCPSCGSTDLEKLKWNEYRCTHCGSLLKLDSERERLELAVWACPECGFGNAVGQRFCSQCGTKLTKTCPRCRTDNYLDVRYCGSCGFAFRLQKVYSHLEAKLASLRQRLAQLQARQAARRAAQRRESESCTMTLLKGMAFLILLPLFPLWLIWLFWKQQEQKKEETAIAQLTSEIKKLEVIRTGSPSQLEEWMEQQRRVAEEEQRVEERQRRVEEKRRAEEKQRRAEKAARKRVPPEREAKGLGGSLQQWFTRQSEWGRFAIVAGVLLMLLYLSVSFANRINPPPEVMVHVPAGEFLMGSNEGDPDAEDDEHPQHTVYVGEFWIDKTEVTNAQYRKCVETGACRAPTTYDYGDPTYSDSSKADHPVVCVSWQDATTYCEWAGKRLPTEAEWEKAARGTDGRKYPWGNSFDGSKVNFCDVNCGLDWKDSGADDGYQRTAPVGSYPEGASPYGALDMAGNVWEWCQDWYDEDYYASSPQRDPQGPSSGGSRAIRGGSWCFNEWSVRAALRLRVAPDFLNYDLGFRCVSQSPPTTMAMPAPTATPEPTDTPARPTKPTSTPPAETILGESIRKQIYLEWVEAQNSKVGDEDVWQEIARRWGITVDAVEGIVAEGLNKNWLQSAATATPVPSRPTQPITEIIPTPTPMRHLAFCHSVTQIPQAECQALVALYNSTNGTNWNHNDGWLQTNTPCSWYGVKCQAPHVTELNLLGNNLEGTIPSELDRLTELRVLDLWANRLKGGIPSELGHLRKLRTFRVYGNLLTGTIPAELGNLIYLENLTLSLNRLTGNIPRELGNLVNLQELHLHSNRLSGGVPSELGNLTNLWKLHIANNSQLSGPLPKSFMKLDKLSFFYYGGTKLCAPADAAFQTWLEGIKDLQTTRVICQ